MLLIPLMILVCAETAGAHTVTVTPNMHFHLWSLNTYINLASTTSLDSVTQTDDKLYLNQYWFSVENANLTISKFFARYQLILLVDAPSDILSITQIYVDNWSEPTSVYSPNGILTWDYDGLTKSLVFRITRLGQTEIIIDWRIMGDSNGDGVVDMSDLFALREAYGSIPTQSNWNSDCDFNRDQTVNILDLYSQARNYGNRK